MASKHKTISTEQMMSARQFYRDARASRWFYLLVVLWVVRVVTLFTPQVGYIQPDEFFQFTEPVAGSVLDVQAYYPWEFKPDFPLRSMLFPQLLSAPWFYLIKSLEADVDIARIKPYLLLVGPRLAMVVCSFFIDLSLLRLLAKLYSGPEFNSKRGQLILRHLNLHASWHCALTFYPRTFSNTIELMMFAYLLAIIFTMSGPKIYTKMGLLLSIGFFNRPTFALFAIVPVLYWLFTYRPNKSNSSPIYLAVTNGLKVLKHFLVGSFVSIVVDTVYHRSGEHFLMCFDRLAAVLSGPSCADSAGQCLMKTLQVLNEHIVFTPLNFAIYNLQTKNLANHGLHPFYFHLLVSMPVLFLSLAVLFYYDLIFCLRRYNWRNISMKEVLFLNLIVSLFGFSYIPHQEPRFLLPLAVIMFVLYGGRLQGKLGKCLVSAWIVLNVILAIFYGYIHQAGVVRSMLQLPSQVTELSHKYNGIDIFFLRMYLPPRHLLALPLENDKVNIEDYSILDFPGNFQTKLSQMLSSRQALSKRGALVVVPSCLAEQLRQTMEKHFPKIRLRLMQNLFPHFTGEDLSASIRILLDSSTTKTWWQRLVQAFSMNIWQLEVSPLSSRSVR